MAGFSMFNQPTTTTTATTTPFATNANMSSSPFMGTMNANASPFGSAQQNVPFGASTTPASSTSAFGGPKPQFGSPGTSLFGGQSASTAPSGLTFGSAAQSSGFAQPQPKPAFGGGFGSTPAATPQAGLAFGSPSTSQTGLLFGTTTITPVPTLPFGSAAPATTQTGLSFGSAAPTTTQTGQSFGSAPAPAQSGLSFGSAPAPAQTGLSFGSAPAPAQTGLSFGSAPAPAQAGLAFGSAPAPAQAGLSFGSAPATSQTGLGFGSTPATTQTGLSFGSTPTTTQTGLSFGSAAPTTTQTGLSFGSAPAPAQSGLSFGSAPAPAQTGLSFGSAPAPAQAGLAFGSAPAPAQAGLSFGSAPATSQTGLGFGSTPATTQTGLSFGSTPTTSQTGLPFGSLPTAPQLGATAPQTSSSFGAPASTATVPSTGLSFGTPTTATTSASSVFDRLGSKSTTTSASTTPNLFSNLTSTATTAATTAASGGMLSWNKPTTSDSSAPVVTSASVSAGLGGVDHSPVTNTQSSITTLVSAKEQPLPNEIQQTVIALKEHIKTQKSLSSEVARASTERLTIITKQITPLKNLILNLGSVLSQQKFTAEKIKLEMMKSLNDYELVQMIKYSPASSNERSLSVRKYFTEKISSFERSMKALQEKMEYVHHHVSTLPQETGLSADALKLIVKKLHDSFVVIGARTYKLHNDMQLLKVQYMTVRKQFVTDNSSIAFSVYRELELPSDTRAKPSEMSLEGPNPFSRTGYGSFNSLLLASQNRSFGASTSNTQVGGLLNTSKPFGFSDISGVSSLLDQSTSQGLTSGQPFNLQKPPLGNKRGKR